MARLKELAHRIELLAPALDSNGASPDNAEYPWPDMQGEPVSPLDFPFDLLQDEREIASLIKIISRAAHEYVNVEKDKSK